MVVVIMKSNIKVGNHVKKSKEEKKLPTFTSQEKVKREGERETEREREREKEREGEREREKERKRDHHNHHLM